MYSVYYVHKKKKKKIIPYSSYFMVEPVLSEFVV